MIEIVLGLTLGGAALVALFRLPLLHPAQLWLLPWGTASSLLALGLLPYAPMNWRTAGLILAGCAAFCVGALGFHASGRTRSLNPSETRYVKRAAIASLMFLGVVLAAFLLQVASQFGPKAAFVSSGEVRQAIQAGTLAITIKYVYLSFAAATLCGLSAGMASAARERWTWLGLSIAAASTAYFSTGRGSIVTAALAATSAFLLASDRPVSRRQLLTGLAAFGALTFAIFSVGGAIIGKTLESNSLSQTRSAFTDHASLRPFALPYQYATAPLVAFGVPVEVNATRPKAKGCATLVTVCAVGQAVGLPVVPEPAIEPFTADPLRWNTYTALDRPLIDGGPAMVPLVAFVLGLAASALFAKARSGSSAARAAYAMIATALLFSSTQMNFFAPQVLGALGASWLLLLLAQRSVGLKQSIRDLRSRSTRGKPALPDVVGVGLLGKLRSPRRGRP